LTAGQREVQVSAALAVPDIPRRAGLVLHGTLRFIMDATVFERLADDAEAVARWLLVPPAVGEFRPAAEAVTVTVRDLASGETETVSRDQSEVQYCTEHQSFGEVDIIYEAAECGVYRERLTPGAVLPTHCHHRIDESELVLTDGLLLQGAPVAAGISRSWPRGYAHRYENPTPTEQCFLCIDRPAFIHSDEVEVDVPVDQLVATNPTRYF
jgi:dihydroneopterin aldolase